MDNALTVANSNTALYEQEMVDVNTMNKRWNKFIEFSKSIMKPDIDYGIIPGVEKPSLYKAGAEKLRLAYSLSVETTLAREEINLDELLLDFTYNTKVFNRAGQVIASCEGNCNSYEPKYRYIWVRESDVPNSYDKSKLKSKNSSVSEFCFAYDKRETQGQYGKPESHWEKFDRAIADGTARSEKRKVKSGKEMDVWVIPDVSYRIPNPDILGLKNTLMKMAQKRSYVGAILQATGASQFYTQDIEDMDFVGDSHGVIIATAEVVKSEPVAEDGVKFDDKGEVETEEKAPESKTVKTKSKEKTEKPAEDNMTADEKAMYMAYVNTNWKLIQEPYQKKLIQKYGKLEDVTSKSMAQNVMKSIKVVLPDTSTKIDVKKKRSEQNE